MQPASLLYTKRLFKFQTKNRIPHRLLNSLGNQGELIQMKSTTDPRRAKKIKNQSEFEQIKLTM